MSPESCLQPSPDPEVPSHLLPHHHHQQATVVYLLLCFLTLTPEVLTYSGLCLQLWGKSVTAERRW